VNLRRVVILLAAMAGLAQPQTGGASASAFEVASIRPSGPHSIRGSDGGPGSPDPGLYRFGSATLLELIAIAYEVKVFQISSSVNLDRQNFDLAAKVPEGATNEQFRAML
jgi:uncharacterized protein (TIGR03435 family)